MAGSSACSAEAPRFAFALRVQNQPPHPSNDGCAGCRLSPRVDTVSGGVARSNAPVTGRLETIDEHERDDRAAGDGIRRGSS